MYPHHKAMLADIANCIKIQVYIYTGMPICQVRLFCLYWIQNQSF